MYTVVLSNIGSAMYRDDLYTIGIVTLTTLLLTLGRVPICQQNHLDFLPVSFSIPPPLSPFPPTSPPLLPSLLLVFCLLFLLLHYLFFLLLVFLFFLILLLLLLFTLVLLLPPIAFLCPPAPPFFLLLILFLLLFLLLILHTYLCSLQFLFTLPSPSFLLLVHSLPLVISLMEGGTHSVWGRRRSGLQ